MEIEITKYAYRNIRRFKSLSEYDVRDAVERYINSDSFQDYFERVGNEPICCGTYDDDLDITIILTSKEICLFDIRMFLFFKEKPLFS